MAKVIHRKTTRRKSARAAKPHSRRSGARPRSTGERSLPIAADPESLGTKTETEEENENIQAQARVREDDSEDEAGAYDERTEELG